MKRLHHITTLDTICPNNKIGKDLTPTLKPPMSEMTGDSLLNVLEEI